MKKFSSDFILAIILAILIVVMIIVIIVKKDDKTIQVSNNNNIVENLSQNTEKTETKIDNSAEEKRKSMTEGSLICKIDNQTILAQGQDIYTIDEQNKQKNKITTLEIAISKMYFDGQNIYCIPEYNQGTGIYKTDLQGNTQKIYTGITLQIWLTDNDIYYVNQIGYDTINKNPQGTLNKMDKDGKNIVQIANSIKNYFYIQGDKIYYTTQTRQMYQINSDGTNPVLLADGRKFALGIQGKYLIYIDYANQEMTNLYNTETAEDKSIGIAGNVKQFLGKTYITVTTTSDNLEQTYTIKQLNEETGETEDIYTSKEIGTNIAFINEKQIYYVKQDGTIGIINKETQQEEQNEEIKNAQYFISNKAYKFDSQTAKLEVIDLSTNQKEEI